jgi:hypothetical protein
MIGILSIVIIFYIVGLARSLKSQSKEDEVILKNSKQVVSESIDHFVLSLDRIVQHVTVCYLSSYSFILSRSYSFF